MRVVIVDDQLSARSLCRRVLQDAADHLAIDDFGDAEEALRWCMAHHPDVVVLDYRMPEMDGLRFLKRLIPALQPRPAVVMMSTSDEPTLRQACLEAGAVAFIPKPLQPVEFRAQVLSLSLIHI